MRRFTKLFSVLFLTLLLFVSSVGIGASTPILIDGDFELGGSAWNKRNHGVISNTESYGEGTYSGSVPDTAISGNMASGFIGQVIKLQPNTNYTVSAYAKVDVKGADAIFTGRWFNNNQQGDVIKVNGVEVDKSVTATDWTLYQYSFNSGYNTQALIQLVKWSEKEETKISNAYIDNVVVEAEEQVLPEDKVYTEIWRDDFSNDSLNFDDWGYELGNIRGTENQHYVNDEENVFFRDGNLVLRATDRAKEDQYDHPRNPARKVVYNSGSVRTHGRREFLYGKFEIKAKLPKGRAVFPAFWTLGADFNLDGKINEDQGRGWPATGEIDIMELTGWDGDDIRNSQVYQTIHYGPEENNVGRFSGSGTHHTLEEGLFNDNFHTFGFDWDEHTMNWYVDDKIVRTVPYAQDPMAKDIFSKPQYIQLNLAMGGAWPGIAGDGLAGTEFIIDYVTFSQTEEQKAASDKYYSNAPKINNVKEVEMNRGDRINPLDGLTHTEGYTLDFSIEDSPMFQHVGGNVNVEQLVSGVHELDKISELPVGKYLIHYSAVPTGVNLTEDLGAITARKSALLTIHPNSIPEDFEPNGKIGDKLSSVKLPEGWFWKNADQIIEENVTYFAYYKDPVNGEIHEFKFTTPKVDNSELKDVITDAEAALKDDKYTQKSLDELKTALNNAKKSLHENATQEEVDDAVKTLQEAFNNLELKDSNSNKPSIDEPGEDKPVLPSTGISTSLIPSIIALGMVSTGIALTRKKKEN